MAQDYLWATPSTWRGVNNTLSDKSIGDDELSDCANYQPDFTGQGWLTKRDGLTKQDTNQRTATTYSIFDGRNNNYYHNGTVVYQFDGTSLDTGRAAAFDSWASYSGYDIFVNGTDARKTSDGTTFSDLAGIPAGTKYIAAANNFLYAAGHDHGKLRYCDYGDITTWSATNELVFSLDEGDDIVALKSFNNCVGAWCTKSFYLVTGYSNTDHAVSYFNKGEGCAGGNNSVVVTPYGVFWWARSGIAWMKTIGTIDYPMLRKLAKTLNGLSRAYDAYVHAAWDSTQCRVMFWLFNGASSVNLRVDYYPLYDAFYIHTGAGVAMSASAPVIINGTENIYVGGYNPTYLYKQSGLTDDSTAITAYFETKREGNALLMRNGKRVAVATDLDGTETITYIAYIDNAVSATKTYSLSIAANDAETEVLLNLANRRIKHRVGDAATATRTKIIGVTHSGQQDKVA